MNKAPGIENAASGGTLELLCGFWAALLVVLVGVIAGLPLPLGIVTSIRCSCQSLVQTRSS
ncbi:hypothetical protein [Bifidobacterium sp. wkB338]|uniref:hypothetical protein n=1 Tax=Bifidobacterium sp. wkB338 TaxID=2025114 RepID=UPI0011C4A163|nr:hypothetical protein [Bifidobacterium sp. wkB338]